VLKSFVVGQDILNADVGVASMNSNHLSLFHVWRSAGFTNSFQLYCTAIGGLVAAALMLFGGSLSQARSQTGMVPECGVDAEPPLAGLLGLGSLAWAGHQIHVSLPD